MSKSSATECSKSGWPGLPSCDRRLTAYSGLSTDWASSIRALTRGNLRRIGLAWKIRIEDERGELVEDCGIYGAWWEPPAGRRRGRSGETYGNRGCVKLCGQTS